MKPRLTIRLKLWYCRGGSVTGIGYTPIKAYDDWANLTLTLWRQA